MRWTLRIIMACLSLMAAMPALAQDNKVDKLSPERPWLGPAVAVVLAGAIAIANTMSSKRGHQD